MSQLNKSEVVQQIKDSGMVPVFNHPDPEICKSIVKACYDGGLRVFEFTNRSEKAFEVFVEIKKFIDTTIPEMQIGVGSIIDAETTTKFINAGADFIVSPALVEEMGIVCKEADIAWSPGTGTLTEIVQAYKQGADIIKLFPGSQVGGPGFAKAALAPLPFLQLMPTGGVSPDRENLDAWFNAGVCCVGMGSKLFPKDWIANREYAKLATLVRNTLDLIEDIRKDI
jgi:2-dehydro-3-deoxyphosphogluconate aldolase/(4S)-4-hydroxy-2-oxoglutarate aldolase